MKDKLKTLNEIMRCKNRKGPEGPICSNCGFSHTITEELLREEAIKWIKGLSYLNKSEKLSDSSLYMDFRCPEYWDFDGVMNWIKCFFSIGDKDLNE